MNRALPTRRLALCIIVAASALNPDLLCGAPAKGKVISEKGGTTGRTNNFSGSKIVYAEGNITFINNVAEIEKALRLHDWEGTKDNPAFRKFVLLRYGKDVDQLKTYKMATFWDDLQAYLEETKKAEANYQQLRQQGTVGDELQALFQKIEEARNDFNYQEVIRLLTAFREKHIVLRQDLNKVDYMEGQTYELLINYPEAERYYKKAAVNEDENPLYLNAYAGILWKSGKYHEAELELRRALAINEKSLGPDHPDVATSLNNLALLLKVQGKYPEAEPLYLRSLAIDEKALGSEHPGLATDLNNLAGLFYAQGKYAEAEPLYRRALAIDEKALGSEHPGFATDLNNLAELLSAQGKYAEAEPLYRRALAIREKQLGTNHPDVAASLNNLAELLRAQGKYAEAEPLFRRAVAILEKSLGPDHPKTKKGKANLDKLLEEMKQKQR